MSAFRRTISGLSNQHLFFDVDLIIFLEGGKVSYNKDQVYEGKFSGETEDIIFWRNLFGKFKSDKRIKFKSVGSKKTVKEIANDIVEAKIETVFVAMDNEFDELLKLRIIHPNILYTHGYSWENDVWNQESIKSIIEDLSAVKVSSNDIDYNFSEFLKQIKIAVYADAYLFKKNSSFFNRENGRMFCVDCNPIDLPSIKQLSVQNQIINKGITKRKASLYGNKNSIDPLKFCFGHFLADYCYQLIQHYLKKRHSLTSPFKEIIHRMSIKKYFDTQFESGSIYDYYHRQFENMNV